MWDGGEVDDDVRGVGPLGALLARRELEAGLQQRFNHLGRQSDVLPDDGSRGSGWLLLGRGRPRGGRRRRVWQRVVTIASGRLGLLRLGLVGMDLRVERRVNLECRITRPDPCTPTV